MLTTAAEEAIKILNSFSVSCINFSFDKVCIEGSHYRRIAAAIAAEHISFITDDDLPSGADACYSPKDDNVYIRSSINYENSWTRMMLVHECTHAIHDALTHRSISKIDNEASAYIAGARYMIMSDCMPDSYYKIPELRNIYSAADKCAQYIYEKSFDEMIPDLSKTQELANLRKALEVKGVYGYSEFVGKLATENDGLARQPPAVTAKKTVAKKKTP